MESYKLKNVKYTMGSGALMLYFERPKELRVVPCGYREFLNMDIHKGQECIINELDGQVFIKPINQ